MSVEVTGEDLAAADAVMESVEWQMSNFMPAKGESGQRCHERRMHAAIAEAVRDARRQAEEAMRERCAEIAERYPSNESYVVPIVRGVAHAIRSIDTRGE